MPTPIPPPPPRRDFHLYRLAPLAATSSASILHVAVGERFLALATSSNMLLLLAAADRGRPPLVRQMRWCSGPSKGVAAMQLHDELGLLVASHDGSAFLLPAMRA